MGIKTSPAPLRILIAEDSKIARLMLQRQLENIGHQATMVSNGLEAIRKLIKQPYDVLLLDVEMPIMDGLKTARTIRESETANVDSDIPIIALTAYDSQEELEKCLSAGMNLCLGKPVDIEALETAMQRLLSSGGTPLICENARSEAQGDGLLLDSRHIQNDFNLMPEDVEELYHHLLEDLPASNRALEEQIRSGAITDAAKTAHGIAGSTVQFLSPKLQNMVKELERTLRKGEDSQSCLEKYFRQSDKLLSVVRDHLKRLKS